MAVKRRFKYKLQMSTSKEGMIFTLEEKTENTEELNLNKWSKLKKV